LPTSSPAYQLSSADSTIFDNIIHIIYGTYFD
jgi:hypothetical protein